MATKKAKFVVQRATVFDDYDAACAHASTMKKVYDPELTEVRVQEIDFGLTHGFAWVVNVVSRRAA